MTKTSVDARGVPATLSLLPSFLLFLASPLPPEQRYRYLSSYPPRTRIRSFHLSFLLPTGRRSPPQQRATSFRSGTLTSLLPLLDLRAPFRHPSARRRIFSSLFLSSNCISWVGLGWGGGNERRNRKKS